MSDDYVEVHQPEVITVEVAAVVGPRGPEGSEGPVGPEGPQGLPGLDGLQGERGPEGPQGLKGDTGPAGKDGIDGLPGLDGKDGINGLPGEKGDPGTDGRDGADGIKGDPGVGVPAGGLSGQVLAKMSGEDFDTRWVTPSDSGGGADLPPVGVEGDVLTTVGGVWQAATPAGGATERVTTTLPHVLGDVQVELAPSAHLIRVSSTSAARVRLYRSEEQCDLDRDRHFQSLPIGDAVLADFKFTKTGDIWCNPIPVLSSVDGVFFVVVDGVTSDVTLVWERA